MIMINQIGKKEGNIINPSFETDEGWVYFNYGAPSCSIGGYSTDWKTDGMRSYLLDTSLCPFNGGLMHTINFNEATGFTFDYNLIQGDANFLINSFNPGQCSGSQYDLLISEGTGSGSFTLSSHDRTNRNICFFIQTGTKLYIDNLQLISTPIDCTQLRTTVGTSILTWINNPTQTNEQSALSAIGNWASQC